MNKLLKLTLLATISASTVWGQTTQKLELRDSFYQLPHYNIGLGGHLSLIDYMGPQGGSYLLNKHTISNKSLFLWEPGVTFSYWKKFNNKIDFTVGLSGNSVNMPKYESDSLFLQERQLAHNYNIKAVGDADFRLVFNFTNREVKKVSPYIAAGVFANVFTKQFSAGVPVGLGLNLKIDQGIFFNIETNYRLNLLGDNQTHLMHKAGLIFWTNQKRHVTNRMVTVQAPAIEQPTVSAKEPEVKPKKTKTPEPAKPLPVVETPKPADSDGDGVSDAEDKCLNVKGVSKYFGCPVPDSDGDGINDDNDKCTREPGFEKYNGCPVPDTDGDGFNDEEDKCLNSPSNTNNGCPEIKKEILQKVAMAAKGVFFETGSAKIKASSFANLNKVVEILNSDPMLNVEIDGHTDNSGDPAKNLALSQERADACKAYFESKGISTSRLIAKGYGDTMPIADNTTAAGKAKNRRTEFKIFN